MKKEIDVQHKNIEGLIKLVKDNPQLRIVPMVDSDIVCEDGYAYWIGQWSKAYIDEIYISDERVYFKSDDFEYLEQEYIDDYKGDFQTLEQIEKWAENKTNELPWEKVITIHINEL